MRFRAKRLEEDNWARQPTQVDGSVDFSNVRVTSTLYNKFVTMPEPLAWSAEVVVQQQQLQVLNVVQEYILQECDNSGNPAGGLNLSREQALGKREISTGIRDHKWRIYGTDKSERLVLDTNENYLKAMSPHFDGMTEVQYSDVLESEKILNNHSKVWCRVVQMGANVGSQNYGRIQKAFQSHYSSLPNAKGARKDHKPEDPEFGYPMRIMMDGKKGPNGPLANIQSQILRPVRKELNNQIGTELLNTEELCHHFMNHVDFSNVRVTSRYQGS